LLATRKRASGSIGVLLSTSAYPKPRGDQLAVAHHGKRTTQMAYVRIRSGMALS
jgi:hypothetical protein